MRFTSPADINRANRRAWARFGENFDTATRDEAMPQRRAALSRARTGGRTIDGSVRFTCDLYGHPRTTNRKEQSQ